MFPSSATRVDRELTRRPSKSYRKARAERIPILIRNRLWTLRGSFSGLHLSVTERLILTKPPCQAERGLFSFSTNAKVYPVVNIVSGVIDIYYSKPFQIPAFDWPKRMAVEFEHLVHAL